MKHLSLLLFAILAIPAITSCAYERTYIEPIEKREIHAGPKPKDYNPATFGQPKIKKHRRRR